MFPDVEFISLSAVADLLLFESKRLEARLLEVISE